jgi:hypothetical protein
MPQLLTPDDLQELTGAVHAAQQANVLDRHGIFYIRRRDGKIRTTWHHVNHPAHQTAHDGPNVEAIG